MSDADNPGGPGRIRAGSIEPNPAPRVCLNGLQLNRPEASHGPPTPTHAPAAIRLPLFLVFAPRGDDGQSDAHGGRRLADVRLDRECLGPGSGRPFPIRSGPAAHPAGGPRRRSNPSRPHFFCLHVLPGRRGPGPIVRHHAGIRIPRSHTRTLGHPRGGARLSDAGAAGHHSPLGSGDPAGPGHRPQRQRHAGSNRARARSWRNPLRHGRGEGLSGVYGAPSGGRPACSGGSLCP